MIHKVIRYFKGYLRIRISGKSVERFLNTCSYKGIYLWNLKAFQSYYEMNIGIKDFMKLKPVIRKTGTKAVIVNRAGFPFFLREYKNRKLFFAGYIICFLIILKLSGYIWKIDIQGNLSNTTENINVFLSSENVETGMKRKDVDCMEIARKLRNHYNDMIWVSASLEGTNLIIQIKENTDIPQVESPDLSNKEEAYDIVASKDCMITKIVMRNGICQIKEGEHVKKGDVLISGQIPIKNDAGEITDYQYCTSDADIYGRFKLSYEDESSMTYFEKKNLNIHKTEYFFCYDKYRFRLGSTENKYTHFTENSLQKKYKNFTVGIKNIYPYQPSKKAYSKNEIQKLLSKNFQYYCNELEKKGVVILQNDVKIYTWSDKAKAYGEITVEMPVGQLTKTKLIEIGEHIDGKDGNNN